jgi:NTE family protein
VSIELNRKSTPMKTALVLSGGGARGLAHLGVMKALEKENIKIDLIVGCSFGALVGGMYAQTPQARVIEKRLKNFQQTDHFKNLGVKSVRKPAYSPDDFLKQFARNLRERVLLNVIVNRISVLKEERLIDAVNYLIKQGKIEKTSIPFACNATDLFTGKGVLFTKGDIRKAIRASTTIPGYFPPIELDNKILVDGAVTYNLPIKFARGLGAKIIIAVDVHPMLQEEKDFRNVFDIIMRSSTITANLLTEESLNDTEILISPRVSKFFWYDFDKGEELIKAGEEATYNQIDQIREFTTFKRESLFRKFFPFRLGTKT